MVLRLPAFVHGIAPLDTERPTREDDDVSIYLDRIAYAARELGDAELQVQRQRQSLYALLVKAYADGERPGLVCEAAGISRQRLHQILAKAKEAVQ